MSINTDFYAPTEKVFALDGKTEACTVRGITPDDIARIVNEHSADVEKVFKMLEEQPEVAEAISNGEASTAVEALSPSLFNSMIATVPALAAKIIAVAADEPTMWSHVQKHFGVVMQFDALGKIARLTFIDKNGFKDFLGNVMALLGSVPKQRKLELNAKTDTSDSAG